MPGTVVLCLGLTEDDPGRRQTRRHAAGLAFLHVVDLDVAPVRFAVGVAVEVMDAHLHACSPCRLIECRGDGIVESRPSRYPGGCLYCFGCNRPWMAIGATGGRGEVRFHRHGPYIRSRAGDAVPCRHIAVWHVLRGGTGRPLGCRRPARCRSACHGGDGSHRRVHLGCCRQFPNLACWRLAERCHVGMRRWHFNYRYRCVFGMFFAPDCARQLSGRDERPACSRRSKYLKRRTIRTRDQAVPKAERGWGSSGRAIARWPAHLV